MNLSQVGSDQWLLLSGIEESDCSGDENDWIKPTIIGYLVGQLIGLIFDLLVISVFKLIMICFTAIQCRNLSELELNGFKSSDALVTGDWRIEDEGDGNCDAVEEASWGRYFFRGMIVGFLIGLTGGVLLGFLCWQIRIYKEGCEL
uniref:Transmembrane protein n=1 Tax=Elaeophora elaphi TaxID=1147741 RepID=A0A0R3RZY9_9BILA